jgi:hypothetical protein
MTVALLLGFGIAQFPATSGGKALRHALGVALVVLSGCRLANSTITATGVTIDAIILVVAAGSLLSKRYARFLA